MRGADQYKRRVKAADGEFFTLLDPSGCGKTTITRLTAAGLGEILTPATEGAQVGDNGVLALRPEQARIDFAKVLNPT